MNGKNEDTSPSAVVVIVGAVLVVAALALLWLFLVGGLAIRPDQPGGGVKGGPVAAKTDEETLPDGKPSEPSSDGAGAEEKGVEQSARAETDAMSTPIEKPTPPESDAAEAPVEKPAPPDSGTAKTPVEEPMPSSTPKAAKTTPSAADKAVAKDDAADGKSYLSLLAPFETIGMKTDDGSLRRTIVLSGEKQQFGIWAQPTEDHGTAQVSYLLKGRFAGLRGKAGVCDAPDDTATGDSAGPSGVLRIYGDGNLLWESGLLKGAGAVEEFDIVVKGVELLALTAESNSPAKQSRFAWGNLELTKE